ncbi:hypothetical protein J0A68_13030 [Algoriphagus sp. H41]|uniref:PH domain-containing protein n=1 Tax=Algoriphagus oliviformis TaxID=2811231 RepID=A0ABS3C446_9BACT|nr:hypothetical protein [Algoriphagus oliviformis]MBN7811872.1 hypothetical protein [Algoriphagus oliviformis]
MIYLAMSLVSLAIIILVAVLFLSKTNTSSNVEMKGDGILLIKHPLNTTKIHLENDLKSWALKRIDLLWRGKAFVLSLQLSNGKTRKIYFRTKTGPILQVIRLLEKSVPDKNTEES